MAAVRFCMSGTFCMSSSHVISCVRRKKQTRKIHITVDQLDKLEMLLLPLFLSSVFSLKRGLIPSTYLLFIENQLNQFL